MKIEWVDVFQIAIGVFIGGAVLIVLYELFKHFLEDAGTAVHNFITG